MRALQGMSRLLRVVVGEIRAENVPALRDVANAAVARERLVRDQGAPALAPAFGRDDGLAVESEEAPESGEQHQDGLRKESLSTV